MRLLAVFVLAFATLSAQTGFRPLFDGKTLDGWDGDPRFWSVQDGAITGSTDKEKTTGNTFLIYRKSTFKDFILEADVKLRNHNSGIQFRSEDIGNWVAKGLQADMAEGNWWGSIYDEKGARGVMVNGWKGKAETVVKPGDWNHVELSCQGDHFQIKINGLLTADLHDSAKLDGIVALQLHAGPPMRVQFRNLRIKETK